MNIVYVISVAIMVMGLLLGAYIRSDHWPPIEKKITAFFSNISQWFSVEYRQYLMVGGWIFGSGVLMSSLFQLGHSSTFMMLTGSMIVSAGVSLWVIKIRRERQKN